MTADNNKITEISGERGVAGVRTALSVDEAEQPAYHGRP
jgi:hypothetical protein